MERCLLTLEQITAGYGRNSVLKGISLSIRPGRLTALIGPNGCGKSTLLKAVIGLLPVSGGTVTLDGARLADIPRRQLARRIAYMPQENYCPDYLTLGELVEIGGYASQPLFRRETADRREGYRHALRTVGLGDMAHRQVNALSGGQRQRAFIAMTLAQDAGILLMDEPVNHLDVTYQYAILELVRDLVVTHGRTVVAVLHDLNLALAFADETVLLSDGELVASGPTPDVITADRLRAVFDLDAEVFQRDGRRICLPRSSLACRGAG